MLVTAGIMAFATACDPIEDRDVLGNSYNPEHIQVEVVQSSNGTGNLLTLKMTTPGVYGYWDYKLDKAYSNEVTFVSPFMGKVDFTYYVSIPHIKNGNPSDREYITKTVQANVQVEDNRLDSAFYALVGENLEGKTWVFDGSGGDGRKWYFMSAPGEPWTLWWNAGGECCPPSDVNGRMVFDVNGGANVTIYPNDGAEGAEGRFKFSSSFDKIYLTGGVNILGAADNNSGNNAGEYEIVELTADRLVLHTGTNNAGTGWTWVFVPEE